jgi:site-specific recombinase XerD
MLHLNDLRRRVIESDLCSNLEKAVILLLLEHGLRISEVIRLDASCLLPGSRLLVRGSKRSNDRLIQSVSYSSDLFFYLKTFGRIDNVYSRFYIYRLCKKLGISFESSISSKISVTHAGRHLFAEILNESGVSLENIQSFVGHKSSKSTQCYVGKTKSKK